ncbi:MAG: hypothetical protein NTY96_00315 [Bacteroidetes bacterium]|nr:hypothetical protein [Bacteroidota bacterium]
METTEKPVNLYNEVELKRMDQEELAHIVESNLSLLSFQDIDEIVQTIQDKLEFHVLEGSTIDIREIKQFRQLFRIYDIYREILYPGLLQVENDEKGL